MIKRVVYTILLAVPLSAPGYEQSVDSRAFMINRPSTHETVNSALISARFPVLEKQAPSCNARTMVSELLAGSDDLQPFDGVSVRQLPESQAFYFISGMTIDADGAPNAYHPQDVGIDELANAGSPGNWNGIITDRDGSPLVQQESDPFPGYYISCTSLFDKAKKFTDPTGYVDSSKIPYIALPKDLADREEVLLGDFAFVVNLRNGKSSYAIYADIGTLGEGSIALADALGISSNARHGGESSGILYLLFPGSGNRQPRGIAEIQDEGEKVLFALKEMKKVSSSSCAGKSADANPAGAF